MIRQERKRLRLQFSKTAQLLGTMEHWQHDTFIVRWDDRSLNADAFVNFVLTRDGAVGEMRTESLSPLTDLNFDFSGPGVSDGSSRAARADVMRH